MTLTVPSCPCGPAAACGAAASSSSWVRTGGRGVTVGGRGWQPPAQPASPRASPRMGGRRSGFLGRRAPLAGAGAGALLPRSRLRPRPPGHSSLQVWSLAFSRLPGPNDPRLVAWRVSVGLSLCSMQVECGILLPAPYPAAATGGGKRVSRSCHRRPGHKQPLLS